MPLLKTLKPPYNISIAYIVSQGLVQNTDHTMAAQRRPVI